jgi:hypothetical protein
MAWPRMEAVWLRRGPPIDDRVLLQQAIVDLNLVASAHYESQVNARLTFILNCYFYWVDFPYEVKPSCHPKTQKSSHFFLHLI